ncbi:MAG: sigma-70 family RNA polymerase sigma factor [Sandaracinaceae bacterium]|nr:sigma-70 family RNA polymerase sigma factor [Sandaracinaceae bacterium]
MEAHPSHQTALLWNQFVSPLRSFVGKRAPREVDPEDVLQDVFVRIQGQLPSLREADRIDAWIFQIARNVIADAYRQRARREALDQRVAAEGLLYVSDDDERAAAVSLAGCLASMIEQLPEPYRQAIELSEIRGMTQAEAAALVGISLSGMKSRVQRGREHLKGIIHEFCRVSTDVRGGVVECVALRGDCGVSARLSVGPSDSMDMNNTTTREATNTNPNQEETKGCCGGPAPGDASACCALDAEKKAAGEAGCGCSTKAASAPKKGCC